MTELKKDNQNEKSKQKDNEKARILLTMYYSDGLI